jgi:hypothetical protein
MEWMMEMEMEMGWLIDCRIELFRRQICSTASFVPASCHQYQTLDWAWRS